MVFIYGSSTIGDARFRGNDGPPGPTGATGATGATGPVGFTGPIGSQGLFVSGMTSDDKSVTVSFGGLWKPSDLGDDLIAWYEPSGLSGSGVGSGWNNSSDYSNLNFGTPHGTVGPTKVNVKMGGLQTDAFFFDQRNENYLLCDTTECKDKFNIEQNKDMIFIAIHKNIYDDGFITYTNSDGQTITQTGREGYPNYPFLTPFEPSAFPGDTGTLYTIGESNYAVFRKVDETATPGTGKNYTWSVYNYLYPPGLVDLPGLVDTELTINDISLGFLNTQLRYSGYIGGVLTPDGTDLLTGNILSPNAHIGGIFWRLSDQKTGYEDAGLNPITSFNDHYAYALFDGDRGKEGLLNDNSENAAGLNLGRTYQHVTDHPVYMGRDALLLGEQQEFVGNYSSYVISEILYVKATTAVDPTGKGEIFLISDDTLRKIEGYLAHKYFITDQLPDDHPYRYTKPVTPGSEKIAFFGVTGPVGLQDNFEINLRGLDDGTTGIDVFAGFAGITANFKKLNVSGQASFTGGVAETLNIYGIEPQLGGLAGNTGEIVYAAKTGSGFGLPGSFYTDDKNLSVNLNVLQESLELTNKNITYKNLFFTPEVLSDTQFEYPKNEDGKTGGKSLHAFYDDRDLSGNSNSGIIPVINLGATGDDTPVVISFREYSLPENMNSTYEIYSGGFGSCCFCEETDIEPFYRNACGDYVSKEYCDGIGGSFAENTACLFRDEGSNCSFEGACCVNNQVVNSNSEVCERFNGIFFPGKVASEIIECPDPCLTGACCVNGVCIDAVLAECDILGGVFFNGSCDTVNCCLQEEYKGACCFQAECRDDYTPYQCNVELGVFQGNNSTCATTECCEKDPGLLELTDAENTEFIPRYTERGLCSVNVNPTENFKPGDVFAGGILLGVIGEPNDYGTIYAKGENPFCLVHGYNASAMGNPGEGGCISCLREFSTQPTTFFINSGVNAKYENNGPCYCDSVMPFSLLPSECISDPDSCARNVIAPYNYNLYEMPFKRHLSQTESVRTQNYEVVRQYYDFAEKYYDDDVIQRKWALVIAPEDLSFNDNGLLSWGLRQSNYDANSSDVVEDGVYVGSPFLDGLIGTRMFDSSSKEWLPWFIEDDENKDEHAYLRWNHERYNAWDPSVDQTLAETNKEYFKEKYADLWESENAQNSAMRLVSNWNEENKFGYNDWYIPSIVELMYVYGNVNMLNAALLRENMSPMTENNYWSSTTGARYTAARESDCSAKDFSPIETHDPELSSTNQGHTSHAHRAFTQSFISGLVSSFYRSTTAAGVRPVRRIPLFTTTKDCEYDNHLSKYIDDNNGDCYNCRTCNCPELNN